MIIYIHMFMKAVCYFVNKFNTNQFVSIQMDHQPLLFLVQVVEFLPLGMMLSLACFL